MSLDIPVLTAVRKFCPIYEHLSSTMLLCPCEVSANLGRYRGNNGFKRKDHLRQHIIGYHKIEATYSGDISRSPFLCVSQDCGWKSSEQNLRSLEDLTEHMLAQHNSSAYICEKESCERVGMNGFATKKDLQAHIKKDHPSPFQCPHPGCGRVGSNGWLRKRDMQKHIVKFHSINEE
jgi:general transcription factor IIIA